MDYRDFQQAASEALRFACDESLDKNEALRFADNALKQATSALLAAHNTRERWLAMQQAACASGMRIIIETGFRSDPVV